MTATAPIEIRGEFRRERWRSPEEGSEFVIGDLTDSTVVKGDAEIGKLSPGLEYRFFGKWDADYTNRRTGQTEKTFAFTMFALTEPHSRAALVKYLAKYCRGVGPVIAGWLFDAFSGDAEKTLRNDPERAVAEVNRLAKRNVLAIEAAIEASHTLKAMANESDALIELGCLLDGRGFSSATKKELMKRWGPLAPMRVKRDPFVLLLGEFPSAGFLRCDRLYMDLGLPPGRRRRQMLCLWHAIKTDFNGHTWFPREFGEQKLREAINGAAVRFDKALKLGERLDWLTSRIDASGRMWIADAVKARNENIVAERITALRSWTPPEMCGEADFSDVVAWNREHRDSGEVEPMPIHASIEERTQRGIETGVCQFCGRFLIHPTSARLGYGPTCAERQGLPWGDDIADWSGELHADSAFANESANITEEHHAAHAMA